MWARIRDWARRLKAETLALWFCCKHPDTPLTAKTTPKAMASAANTRLPLSGDCDLARRPVMTAAF